jgi:predicted CoA-binding protein
VPGITAPDALRRILRDHSRIAVVGLSPRPERPSHWVSEYMAAHGYAITPVNPTCERVLDLPARATLADAAADGPLEIVNVFRRPDAVPAILEEAIALGARVVWLQPGLRDPAWARRGAEAGVEVVMDRCIKVDHARLI